MPIVIWAIIIIIIIRLFVTRKIPSRRPQMGYVVDMALTGILKVILCEYSPIWQLLNHLTLFYCYVTEKTRPFPSDIKPYYTTTPS